jgi:hypothetical protein
LMIWQFFTPRPSEELRIGPIDVSGTTVVFTAQNVGSVDAEIRGIACYLPGTPPPINPVSTAVNRLGGGDRVLRQGESATFSVTGCGGAEPGKQINVLVFTKNKAYGPFTVIVRS